MVALRSLLPLALVVLLVPACDDDDDDVILTDPVQDTVDQGHVMGQTLANTASDELSGEEDYLIVVGKTASILAALNDGEISQADFALNVVIAQDVAEYAARILEDHTTSNDVLDQVVLDFATDFIPNRVDADLTAAAMAGLATLQQTPPDQIDFAYVDLQVRMHAAAQVLLSQLRDMVTDDEMGAFIDDTRVMIDDHLAQGEDLLATFF